MSKSKIFIPELPAISMRKSQPVDVTLAFTTALQNAMLSKDAAIALQSLTKLRTTILTYEIKGGNSGKKDKGYKGDTSYFC